MSNFKFTNVSTAEGPHGVMFEQTMIWHRLGYADLVAVEEAVGRGLLENPIALGRARIAAAESTVSVSPKLAITRGKTRGSKK